MHLTLHWLKLFSLKPFQPTPSIRQDITAPKQDNKFIQQATPNTALGKTGHTSRPLLGLDHFDKKTKAIYLVSDLTSPANPKRAEFIDDLLALCERYQVKP